MKISHKLYSLGIIAILGLVAIYFTASQFANSNDELNRAINLVDKLEVKLVNLRRNEKDFLLRQDLEYRELFQENSQLFLNLQTELDAILLEYELGDSLTLRSELQIYQQAFEQLVEAYQTLGLDDQTGLWKNYYQAIEIAKQQASTEELLALNELHQQVLAGTVNTPLANSLLLDAANAIIAQKHIIGLNYKEGLLGTTRDKSRDIEEDFTTFSATLSQSVAEKQSTMQTIKTITAITVALLILLIIFQISRSINQRVHTLLVLIQRIAETNDISLRAELKGQDEIASVGMHFNQLITKFEQLISSSQSKSGELYASASNMQNELGQVTKQFDVQSEQMELMSTSVQQMVSTISEISESTTVAVDVVRQATLNAKDGRSIVMTTVEKIDLLSSTLQKSQQSINSLDSLVENIGGAVSIIQGIAEQTNLLALNAAIEAARAGEQGRGFAVVADEVRLLATRTRQSTEQITNVVSNIQSQMGKAVSDIDLCNTQGHETLQASQLLDKSLQQILRDMDTIEENSQRIATAIEEQGCVMDHFSDSIDKLNTISDNSIRSAQHCLTEVANVSTQAQAMDQAVTQFRTSGS